MDEDAVAKAAAGELDGARTPIVGPERVRAVVESDFRAIIGLPRLEDGHPTWRAGIHEVSQVAAPMPRTGGAISGELGDEGLIARLGSSEPGSEHPLVAVPCEPGMHGKQGSASQGEDQQGSERSQGWRRARADGDFEGRGRQGKSEEDVGWPDDEGRGAPASEDRSDAQEDESAEA
jgi:hypothetical protein